MRQAHYAKFILALLILVSFQLRAGGELPFPFQQEHEMRALNALTWQVDTTNLIVQMKILQNPADLRIQWIKIWIKGDDGFVWSRTYLQKSSDHVITPVTVNQTPGLLDLHIDQSQGSSLKIGDQVFKLVVLTAP